MLEHMRYKQVRIHKIKRTEFTLEIAVVVVRLEMASEMGWPRVSLLAVLHDAGVVSR